MAVLRSMSVLMSIFLIQFAHGTPSLSQVEGMSLQEFARKNLGYGSEKYECMKAKQEKLRSFNSKISSIFNYCESESDCFASSGSTGIVHSHFENDAVISRCSMEVIERAKKSCGFNTATSGTFNAMNVLYSDGSPYPTRYSCQQKKCVPFYDGPKKSWSLDEDPRKGGKNSKGHKRYWLKTEI